jgi:hypothetical protein
MDADDVLERLSALPPTLFERVIFQAEIPQEHLPGVIAPQTTRAIAVIKHVQQQGQLGRLVGILERVAGRPDRTVASNLTTQPGLPVTPRPPSAPLAAPRPPSAPLAAPRPPSAPLAAPRPPSAPLVAPAPGLATSAELRERLIRMKQEVTATLNVRPRALAQLAARIGCDPAPETLSERLVEMYGSEAAAHVLAVFDEQPLTPDGERDRAALESVLFIVLPYVSDWRDEVAACCARRDGEPAAVELRYRSDTIAEAVMAGWVGRRCFFEHRAGAEPYGVGAVQIPAAAQTALFASEQHLLESVVLQLARQLDVGGLSFREQRMRVAAALRSRDQRKGFERMRYYFLFRDAASPDDPAGLWCLARMTLQGLPRLALVRMQGQLSDAEADLEESVAALLRQRTL